MIKLQKNKGDDYYCYGQYHNYKAIKDFHLVNGLNDSYFKPQHCMILTFITESFFRQKKMPSINHLGKRYVLMNTNFIMDNLPYLQVKERQIKNYIKQLSDNKFINLYNEGNRNRYVNVNSKFVELCYQREYLPMSAVAILAKSKTHFWKMFVDEWKPRFKDETLFNKFLVGFDSNRLVKQSSYNPNDIAQHIINAVRKELKIRD
jgi:hypothetical protein